MFWFVCFSADTTTDTCRLLLPSLCGSGKESGAPHHNFTWTRTHHHRSPSQFSHHHHRHHHHIVFHHCPSTTAFAVAVMLCQQNVLGRQGGRARMAKRPRTPHTTPHTWMQDLKLGEGFCCALLAVRFLGLLSRGAQLAFSSPVGGHTKKHFRGGSQQELCCPFPPHRRRLPARACAHSRRSTTPHHTTTRPLGHAIKTSFNRGFFFSFVSSREDFSRRRQHATTTTTHHHPFVFSQHHQRGETTTALGTIFCLRLRVRMRGARRERFK